MTEDEKNPIDQIVDLLVYAPLGLIYEYPEVLPKLVNRGKSQVQLAKVMGQMAAKKGQQQTDDAVSDVVEMATTVLAKGLTELGTVIGLAPPPEGPSSAPVDVTSAPVTPGRCDAAPLPIAGYDSLTAKEIIPLLDELDQQQRDRVRAHEMDGRNRKTVLAKLDRLDG